MDSKNSKALPLPNKINLFFVLSIKSLINIQYIIIRLIKLMNIYIYKQWTECSNYRGITLLSMVGKIYAGILVDSP